MVVVKAQSVAASPVSLPFGRRTSDPVTLLESATEAGSGVALDEGVRERADERPLDRPLVGESVDHSLVARVEEGDSVGRTVLGIDPDDAVGARCERATSTAGAGTPSRRHRRRRRARVPRGRPGRARRCTARRSRRDRPRPGRSRSRSGPGPAAPRKAARAGTRTWRRRSSRSRRRSCPAVPRPSYTACPLGSGPLRPQHLPRAQGAQRLSKRRGTSAAKVLLSSILLLDCEESWYLPAAGGA